MMLTFPIHQGHCNYNTLPVQEKMCQTLFIFLLRRNTPISIGDEMNSYYNETLQKNSNLGRKNNQNFVNIPVGNIKEKLEYLCKLNGINFVKQEESYISKASFFDKDKIPKYNEYNPVEHSFLGKRIKRGLYQSKTRYSFNADCNGALNILCKSSVVSLEALYSRSDVDTPIRIRIA
jgi:putative transposase